MTGRILTAVVTMMIALTADCSVVTDTGQSTITSERQTLASYPDSKRIKADLIGHFMYVADGLPKFWEFSSPSTIQYGNIGSVRRKGDLLEFNFTLFVVDYKTMDQNLYRAETVITYKEIAGSWELLTVQGNTIKKAGVAGLTMPDYLQNDC